MENQGPSASFKEDVQTTCGNTVSEPTMFDYQLEQNIEALQNSKKTLVEKHEFLQEILVQSTEISAAELELQLRGLEAQAKELVENKAELLKSTHDLTRKKNTLKLARDVLECERDVMRREINTFEQGENRNNER